MLHLVHRPSVSSVLLGLLRKRLLPTENCMKKSMSFSPSPPPHSPPLPPLIPLPSPPVIPLPSPPPRERVKERKMVIIFIVSPCAVKDWFSIDSCVQQTSIKISLKCPVTFKKITIPARGGGCKHIQVHILEHVCKF